MRYEVEMTYVTYETVEANNEEEAIAKARRSCGELTISGKDFSCFIINK